MSAKVMLAMQSLSWASALLAGSAWASEPAVGLADLDVPLTLSESAGVERKGDVCSTGVPLPYGVLQEPRGIAVFGPDGKAVSAQFRVLERWRDFREDKSVKWLLVTFLADVPAGGKAAYRLKAGKNPAPAKPVGIAEKGDAYAMGGVSFKKDFTSPFKLVLTDADGKEKTTAGQDIKWSVWEAGPVRACLKAESPTLPGTFGFIAWVYAYAPSTGSGRAARRWDLTVVLKNTPRKFRGPFYFKDFSVVWEPPELTGAKDFLLGGEPGKAVGGRLVGHNAYLFQTSDGTDRWAEAKAWGRHHGLRGSKPEFRGYKAFDGDREIGTGDAALGWAAVNGGGRGALVCTRYFRPQYPKAVEVEPGRIVVRLWPRQWKSHGGLHWLDDLQRKAHDVSFRLAPRPVTVREGDGAAVALDSFLVAHAPGELYAGRSAEPIRGVPTYLAKKWRGYLRNGDWVIFGARGTSTFKHVYHGGSLDPFAKSSLPFTAHMLRAHARLSSGMVPLWMDDYRYPRDTKALKHAHYCYPLRDPHPWVGYRPGTGHHNWMPWNHSHFCCGELFDGWRLFGDPLLFEAVKGVGAYCQSYVDYREGPKWEENIPTWTHNGATWEGGGRLPAGSRADGMPLHNLCQAYSITGDESMVESLRRFAAVSWRQVDKVRGFYATGDCSGVFKGRPKGTLSEDVSMVAQVMDGLLTYYRLTHDETTADQITGMLDWIMAEGTAGKYGHLYHPPVSDGEQYAAWRTRYIEGVRRSRGSFRFQMDPYLYLFAYDYTGDQLYRDQWNMLWKGMKELRVNPEGVVYGMVNLHFRTSAAQLNETINAPRRGRAPDAVKDLAAEALGGGPSTSSGQGKVKLAWTAPPGKPARYQVKWADKRIVERLRFDRAKRTFQFDPKDHANWWAANNVEREPEPSSAGTRHLMTLTGLPPGTHYFAIRSFDAASNRSAISNVVKVRVR